jgi:hypothetical protein
MNDVRLHPDLARVLRQVNQGHVHPAGGKAWLRSSLTARPVDVTIWIKCADLDEYVEVVGGKYALTADGVMALVTPGGRA